MRTYAFLIVVALLLQPAGPAWSAVAPDKLRGKSVVVTWSETRVQRNEDQEQFRTVTIQHDVRTYVSSVGRVFSRLTNTNQRGRSGKQDAVGQTERRVPSFTGRSMTVVMTGTARGARRIAVDFGADFGSCTAQVLRGKEVGAATMSAKSSITGKTVIIQSLTVNNVACRVQDGNVFGGE